MFVPILSWLDFKATQIGVLDKNPHKSNHRCENRKQHNAGHQRRARTAANDKPRMRDMLIARPLHAIVSLRTESSNITLITLVSGALSNESYMLWNVAN